MKKKNAGAATIVVVCVMALIMALSLGLFTTASVLMKTAVKQTASSQCRILAVSFSEEVEEALTGEKTIYQSRREEEAGRAECADSLSLWHYVRQNITDGAWPCLEENTQTPYEGTNAVRSFAMENAGICSEIADTTLSLYWLQTEGTKTPSRLVVKTSVTVKGQACAITDIYDLKVTELGDYESWEWKHAEKK